MDKTFIKALSEAREIKCDEKGYASSYFDNIFQNEMDEKHIRMFCRGEGKELFPKEGEKEKAACIYSSSMLAYNFFSWIDKNIPSAMMARHTTKCFLRNNSAFLRIETTKPILMWFWLVMTATLLCCLNQNFPSTSKQAKSISKMLILNQAVISAMVKIGLVFLKT